MEKKELDPCVNMQVKVGLSSALEKLSHLEMELGISPTNQRAGYRYLLFNGESNEIFTPGFF